MNLKAKLILKNKFWVVEHDGKQCATIQATDDGVVYVQGAKREKFVNFKTLSKKYNIKASGTISRLKTPTISQNIYGFPIVGKAYNVVFDIRRKLPFYTKSPKSKSFYCAGFYAININGAWSTVFCPKSISINRYPYYGPYITSSDADRKISDLITLST